MPHSRAGTTIYSSMRRLAVSLQLLLFVSCSGTNPPTQQPAGATAAVPGLSQRALLLLLADRRMFESFAIIEAGTQPDVGIREAMAVSLGHIGDERGRPELEVMLAGQHTRIRRAAAFSLGQLGLSESWPNLTQAVRDRDVETAIWSVDALARSGADLGKTLKAVEGINIDLLWPRLLPYLFRFPPEQTVGVARQALDQSNPELRAMAAYAIARNPVLSAVPSLRSLLEDPDPWVRGWAARALGQVGTAQDLEAMRPLLDDRHPGPVIQTLRSSHRLISLGRAAPPEAWRTRLVELMGDDRPGVSVTALEASASWLLDERISDVLVRTIESGDPHFRETALMALVNGGDARGLDFAYQFALSDDPTLRELAAKGLADEGNPQVVETLFQDSDARVRVAALDTLLETSSDRVREQLSNALRDTDPAVSGTAFAWLAKHPVLPAEDLSRALANQQRPELIEVRLNATQALVARGREEPLERGLVVRNLESLAQVGDFPARRAAAEALSELGRDRPAIAPADTRKSASTYQDILLIMDEPKLFEIMTRHGAIRVSLQCPSTPMTCLNFLQLTNQGFYDGLEFHRVVPDFVVQGGDPRGDGWGGPGYTIRDELNRLPFDRGVVGMASAGPDTAGSQFFITLSRQPHLDGLYTAFGEVTHGLNLLDSIIQGDRIESIREIR